MTLPCDDLFTCFKGLSLKCRRLFWEKVCGSVPAKGDVKKTFQGCYRRNASQVQSVLLELGHQTEEGASEDESMHDKDDREESEDENVEEGLEGEDGDPHQDKEDHSKQGKDGSLMKRSKEYIYNKNWETEFPWLRKDGFLDEEQTLRPYCDVCNFLWHSFVNSGHFKVHQDSKRHKKKAAALSSTMGEPARKQKLAKKSEPELTYSKKLDDAFPWLKKGGLVGEDGVRRAFCVVCNLPWSCRVNAAHFRHHAKSEGHKKRAAALELQMERGEDLSAEELRAVTFQLDENPNDKQKYRTAWEDSFPWLLQGGYMDDNNQIKPYCTICELKWKANVNANHLKKHESSESHKQKAKNKHIPIITKKKKTIKKKKVH